MLWRLFVVLVLGGFIAIYSCEPVSRKHLLKTSGTIECASNGDDISKCKTHESADTSSPNSKNQTQSNKEARQRLLDDINDVSEGENSCWFFKNKPAVLYYNMQLRKVIACFIFFFRVILDQEKDIK